MQHLFVGTRKKLIQHIQPTKMEVLWVIAQIVTIKCVRNWVTALVLPLRKVCVLVVCARAREGRCVCLLLNLTVCNALNISNSLLTITIQKLYYKTIDMMRWVGRGGGGGGWIHFTHTYCLTHKYPLQWKLSKKRVSPTIMPTSWLVACMHNYYAIKSIHITAMSQIHHCHRNLPYTRTIHVDRKV